MILSIRKGADRIRLTALPKPILFLRAFLKIHRDRIIFIVILILKTHAKTEGDDEDEKSYADLQTRSNRRRRGQKSFRD